MKFAYLAVEGPHDVAFVGRFLKAKGILLIDTKVKLNNFWWPLLPTRWPAVEGTGDILRRVSVPTFFQNADWSVALDSANGDTKLLETLTRAVQTVDVARIEALGLVLDADTSDTPAQRFARMASGMAEAKLPAPSGPGVVIQGPPRAGVYVLPDNATAGTLEDMLIECADKQYPDLLLSSQQHIGAVKATIPPYQEGDLDDFLAGAGKRKAIVGSIGAVLRPGKAIQTSIQDNRWVDGAALELPRLKSFSAFVDALLGAPGSGMAQPVTTSNPQTSIG